MVSIRFIQTRRRLVRPEFHEGDAMVPSKGTYQGTTGVFLHLRQDVKWADVAERDGSIRSRPVTWLALSGSADRIVLN